MALRATSYLSLNPVKVFRLLFKSNTKNIALNPCCCNIIQCCASYSINKKKTIRIGCASGFWGDTAVSAPQLIHYGELDFLVFDYLSEITMSLLAKAKQKLPNMGYAPDFVQVGIGPYLNTIKQKGIRVISNAGGINPEGCASAIHSAAKAAGVDLKIAVITGDNLMSEKANIELAGMVDMFSSIPFPSTITSMTAYLGGGGIAKALDMGADIVITGRCTDSALALGPLMHTFEWRKTDYDLLAAGSLAGHLIECGPQSTGGIFTDWHSVPDWHNIGFPIVECSENGEFILTKPPNTGGLVSVGTVSEQLVYEIGDPRSYLLPDVTADFSNVHISQIAGRNGEAVSVTGAKGRPPTNQLKVSATYLSGYRLTALFLAFGPRARDMGCKTADAIVNRVRGIYSMLGLADFTKLHIQLMGAEDNAPENQTSHANPCVCVIWVAAAHKEKKALEILAREFAPAGTGMAPGLGGFTGGRPKVSPVLKLFSFLYPKDKVKVSIQVGDSVKEYRHMKELPLVSIDTTASDIQETGVVKEGTHSFRLEDLAFARSGDKGNDCNIGVIARHPSYVPYLRKHLTADAVYKYMAHVFDENNVGNQENVIRYELPGINGFNFLLRNSLGGGGIASLRPDPQSS